MKKIDVTIELPKGVEFILNRLAKFGKESYIVGGCVRDWVMNRPINDYDITTDATPNQVEEIFSDYNTISIGKNHGTIGIVVDGVIYEVTTYRVDGEYKDGRHPESVSFSSQLSEDLSRRDFTINALCYSHTSGIVDLFDGYNHILGGKIVAVGNPEKRFMEDGLRILRALRFSSVLCFDIEENTAKSIHNCRHNLLNISNERIQVELTKLIQGNNVAYVLREFIDVFEIFIPEIVKLKGFDQNNPYHIYDVLEHTIMTVQSIEADPLLRLAMLFHDFGKPDSYFYDSKGGHFYGHNKISADIAKSILRRLKFSNDKIEYIYNLVYYHDAEIVNNKIAVKRRLNKWGKRLFFDIIKMKKADSKGQNPIHYEQRQVYYNQLITIAKDILSSKECFNIKSLKINGNDIIQLGIPQGEEVGRILSEVLEKVIHKELINRRIDLLAYVRNTYV